MFLNRLVGVYFGGAVYKHTLSIVLLKTPSTKGHCTISYRYGVIFWSIASQSQVANAAKQVTGHFTPRSIAVKV